LSDEVASAVLEFSRGVWEPVVHTGVLTETHEMKQKYAHMLINAMQKTDGGFRRRLIVEFRKILGNGA
jgi:hypothetical protein